MQRIDWQLTTGDTAALLATIALRQTCRLSTPVLTIPNSLVGRSYNDASESGHLFLSTTPLLSTPALLPSGAMWLARGPGHQPQRQETLARGPSMTRPVYDVNVPLRHH